MKSEKGEKAKHSTKTSIVVFHYLQSISDNHITIIQSIVMTANNEASIGT